MSAFKLSSATSVAYVAQRTDSKLVDAKPRMIARNCRKPASMGSHPYLSVAMFVALFAIIVPNGAVESPIAQLSAIFLLLIHGCILCTASFDQSSRRLALLGLFCVCPLIAFSLLQVVPLPLGVLSHPVWSDLGKTIEVSHGYLSVNPSRSLDALPLVILPFLTFFAVLLIAQEGDTARILWHGVTCLGLTVLLLSIILEVFFPGTYFFSGAPMKNGALNGVFHNRNVSAAFFVLTGFAVLGSFALVQEKTYNTRRSPQSQKCSDRIFDKRKKSTILKLGMLLVFFFICIVSVATTKSRAGVLAGLPLLLFCLSFVLIRASNGRSKIRPYRLLLILVMTSFLLTIFLIVFGGPVLSRVEFEQTNSRSCVHQGTLDAIVSNFPWGTGLGTFPDVFPIYRPAECGGLTDTWHRAHNSFLELTLTNGIVGPVVVISLLGAILYQGFVILRPCSERQFTPVILLSMLIYLILHSMVDFPLQIPGVTNYVAVMAACAIGLFRRE